MYTFATTVTMVTSVHWLVWLRERAKVFFSLLTFLACYSLTLM